MLIDWFLSKARPEEALAEYLDATNIEDRSITDRLDVSIVDKIEQLLLEEMKTLRPQKDWSNYK